MPRFQRSEILARLRNKIGAGRYRMAGRGSLDGLLAYGNATEIVVEMARDARKDIMILCHGGPISSPQDAAFVLETYKSCHGFYGASSMERLPSERALTEQMQAFVNIGKD